MIITEQEFLETVEDMRHELLEVAVRNCTSPGDAEDAIQEAVMSCLANLRNFDPYKSALRTWIIGAVISRAWDTNKHYVSRNRIFEANQDYEQLGDSSAVAYEPEHNIKLDVDNAIAQLPPAEADAIRAVYIDGYTEQEYAERSGVSRSTVTRLIRDAKTKLKGSLAEYR